MAPPAFAAEKKLQSRAKKSDAQKFKEAAAWAEDDRLRGERFAREDASEEKSDEINRRMRAIKDAEAEEALQSRAKKSEKLMASTSATESFEERRMRETQPTKPTKHMNMWHCFLSDKEVQQDVRDLKVTEEHKHKHLNTIAKELWSECMLDQLPGVWKYAKFRALADQDNARYKKEAAVYRAAMIALGYTDESIDQYVQIKRPTKQADRGPTKEQYDKQSIEDIVAYIMWKAQVPGATVVQVQAFLEGNAVMDEASVSVVVPATLDGSDRWDIMRTGRPADRQTGAAVAVASIGMFCSVSGPDAGTGTLIGAKFGGVRHGGHERRPRVGRLLPRAVQHRLPRRIGLQPGVRARHDLARNARAWRRGRGGRGAVQAGLRCLGL